MIAKVIEYLVSFLFFLLMMITTIDVIGRYIFNYPLVGSLEMTEFILGLAIFSTIILLNRNNEHIAVDIFEKRFSKQFRIVRDFLVHLFTLIGLGVMLCGIYFQAIRSQRDHLMSEYLEWPIAFFDYLSAGLLLVSLIYTISNLVSFIFLKKTNKKNISEEKSI